jgi:N-acetyl-anhydromuramyl-L-alanine amidase AmpD
MNIIETNLPFKYAQQKRTKTDYIVVHHTAHPNCSIQDIHRWHQEKGWNGVGYHYFIRKNGNIYRGRDKDAIGSHCLGINEVSVGVSLEGNFDTEYPSDAQKSSLNDLLQELIKIYPQAKIIKHSDKYATSCPGKLFDDNLLNINLVDEYQEAIKVLVKNGVITTPTYWQSITTTAKADFVKELIKNLAKFISKK